MKEKFEYVLQQGLIQPTENSCVSTCVAMIVGKFAEEVIAELHESYNAVRTPAVIKYLMEAGFNCAQVLPDCLPHFFLETPGHYLCTVPSLNVVGGLHCVLINIDIVDGQLFQQLIDPQNGKEGLKYYTLETLYSFNVWIGVRKPFKYTLEN